MNRSTSNSIRWVVVFLYTAIVYLTLPYGPLIREKIYKSFPPKILEKYPLQFSSFQVKEKRSILYSAEGNQGLGIYDISTPDTLNEISRIATDDTTYSFYESRKILYLASGKSGVEIVDVKEPAAPQKLSRIDLHSKCFDVIAKDQYLYVAAAESGLVIIDISEKASPEIISRVKLIGACRKIGLHANIVIAGTESAMLFLVDVENRKNPGVISSINVAAPVSSILLHENLLFIGCTFSGIKIIDISNIASPEIIGQFESKYPVFDIRHRNGYLYAANGEQGLIIIDVTNPRQPQLQRIFRTANPVTYVYSRYYFAYLADTTPAAYFIDIDTGRNFVVYFVAVILALILTAVIIYLIRAREKYHLLNYISLVVIAIIYGYFLHGMLEIPIEAIHFLEYGFLSILVFLAFKNHIQDVLIFFVSALLITLIGIGDEFFQWLLPNRSWDFRDIGFNALSGSLVQLAIWLGLSPDFIKNKISRRSIKMVSVFFILLSFVFTLLLSMTPQVNNKLAEKFALLRFLKNPEPITEYGYKIFHPDIGGFFSRFKEKELLQYDKKHGAEVAQVLNKHYLMSYKKFLQQYAPGNAPFIHEMRVHLFRRDRYFQDRRLWVAYKENLILENYFSNSLQRSLYKWKNDEMELCREQLGERVKDFYVSPVSENVITAYDLKTVWIIFFLLLGIVIIVLIKF